MEKSDTYCFFGWLLIILGWIGIFLGVNSISIFVGAIILFAMALVETKQKKRTPKSRKTKQ